MGGKLEGSEQGALLGAVLSGRGEHLERLGGGWGERCRAAHRRLMSLDRSARRREIQLLGEALASPLPRGIERLHPSRIARALERQPAAVAGAVVELLPDALARHLRRFESEERRRLPAALRLRLTRDLLGRIVEEEA